MFLNYSNSETKRIHNTVLSARNQYTLNLVLLPELATMPRERAFSGSSKTTLHTPIS
jgi:hypothetical protein